MHNLILPQTMQLSREINVDVSLPRSNWVANERFYRTNVSGIKKDLTNLTVWSTETRKDHINNNRR